jgi:hypothetical protein
MKPEQRRELINTHAAFGQSERDEWDQYHRWYLGEFWDNSIAARDGMRHGGNSGGQGDELTLETNYPYAFIDTMIANICPTNPMVTILALNPEMKGVATAREHLANSTIRQNKLHERAQEFSINAAICGHGVTKTVWFKPYSRPRTYVIDPRHFMWDRTVAWEDARFCAEATVLTEEQFKARAKKGPDGEDPKYNKKAADQAQFNAYPQWMNRRNNSEHRAEKTNRDVERWVVVWEFYDFEEGKYLHMLVDVEEPLFEGDLPFKYMRNPFDLIVFNKNMRDSAGISDIKLIRKAQERLNEIDTLELIHAQTTIPHMLVDMNKLHDPASTTDGLELMNGPGGIMQLRLGNQTHNMSDVFQFSQTPNIGPSWDKMRQVVTHQIEFILGLPAYMRGAMGSTDIATEAALTDTATRTRNGRRIKAIEDWVTSTSKKYIALWAEFMSEDDSIPVRAPHSRQAELRDFTDFGFQDSSTFDNEWSLEYEAAAYSPTENHRLVQLQKIQQFMPTIMQLIQANEIDSGKFTSKFLELLQLNEIKGDGPPQGPPTLPSSVGGAGGSPGIPGEGQAPGVSGAPSLPGPGGNLPGNLEDTIQAFQPPNPLSGADVPTAK